MTSRDGETLDDRIQRQRRQVERREDHQDAEEEFAEEKTWLLAAGDTEGWTRLKHEFAETRRAFRLDEEAEGLRGPGTGVQLSTNMALVWLKIAIEQEAIARHAEAEFVAHEGGADDTDWLGRTMRAAIVTVTSAAFAIEGLYGSVCYFVPKQSSGRRWAKILKTLRLLFNVTGIPKLDQRLERLFELRDLAAHPWVAVQHPLPHPAKPTRVSVEVATFTASAATAAVDVACELLHHCTTHPLPGTRRARRWSDANRHGAERVLSSRPRTPPQAP
jgi:hypothetical protein